VADKEVMTKTSFRLSEEEKKALEEYANEHDLSVSQVIRRACREYLRVQNDKNSTNNY